MAGWGWLTNPRRAAYGRTTRGCPVVIEGGWGPALGCDGAELPGEDQMSLSAAQLVTHPAVADRLT